MTLQIHPSTIDYINYTEGSVDRKMQGVLHRFKRGDEPLLVSNKAIDEKGVRNNDVWEIPLDENALWENELWKIPFIAPSAKERLGYPTQKPEKLLEKIISASSNEGDVVLDAYCGCGTTVAVAQKLNRQWTGIDITYQSISLILKRLEGTFGADVLKNVFLDGIPKDMASAQALANKKDDRVRKEFEKWALLTYSNNRAIVNDKKGSDRGIDGVAYFATSNASADKIVFQVKSGKVGRGDVAKLRGDMERETAQLAVFITLAEPTGPMREEAAAAGLYRHEVMSRSYNKIQIVTIKEIIEEGKKLEMPLSFDAVKTAERQIQAEQGTLDINE